ncbi:MAG: pitrilysin family protein [Bacteroidia bacterium]|nr:pitrilysin family protein [Bacteroidia bacterium]
MIVGKADCGLGYAVKRSGSSVGYCALSIRCGTRDEEGFHSGIAHFTEHTIFKGTERKSASVINSYLDRLGGELNAYTTKEEIVFHATVLKEDLSKAAGLLFELATQATFPEKEIATEKGVVIDEIQSYKDSPADEVYDRFEEALFAGHPLGGAILGTPASVRKITSEELKRFVKQHFTPDRMAFTVVADFDETRMERAVLKLVQRYFSGTYESTLRGELPPKTSAAPTPPLRSACGSPSRPRVALFSEGVPDAAVQEVPLNKFDRTVDKRNHEVNAVIGGLAPSLYDHKDRITAVLLANILGGPASNSILNDILREKNGWVYGVECGYTQYRETGIMAISLGCDKENLDKCTKAIAKSIACLQEKPLSGRKLKAAKKQLLGQLAVSSESGESQCLSMGKSMLAYGRVATDSDNRAAVEAVTSEDLQNMAKRIFNEENLSRLVFL